ncbi:MAG: hypothetical protein ACR2ML_12405 [Solirubrobacteraceae bacterium]
MPRPRRVAVAAALGAVAVFLATSALVARVLAARSDERAAAIAVIKAQVRGDRGEVLRLLDGCRPRPACATRVRRTVARLRRSIPVDVLNVSDPGISLGSRTGATRVAWRTGSELPVVQCITARRTGNPLAGYEIALLDLSAPIGREAGC